MIQGFGGFGIKALIILARCRVQNLGFGVKETIGSKKFLTKRQNASPFHSLDLLLLLVLVIILILPVLRPLLRTIQYLQSHSCQRGESVADPLC